MVECACSMMTGKDLSNYCMEEAITTTIYLKNKTPTRYLDFNTPLKALHGFKPIAHHLRIFRCKAFSHIPKEKINKLDAKGIRYVFLSYC